MTSTKCSRNFSRTRPQLVGMDESADARRILTAVPQSD